MKNVFSLLLVALASTVLLTINSCMYRNEEELYPACDTAGVTYTATIVPILQNNCYRCHGTATNAGSGGIDLQDYDVLKTYAADGRLYGNSAHLPGFIPMPYDGGKLSDCDLLKLKNWIEKGYPKN